MADLTNRIKVYKGTNVIFEDTLANPPIAVETFFENTKKPMIPYIAIASEDCIFLYYKYKPFTKFVLPDLDLEKDEIDLWSKLDAGSIDLNEAIEGLNNIRENGKDVSNQTIELLALESSAEQDEFIASKKGKPIK